MSHTVFIAQPDIRLGDVLQQHLKDEGTPSEAVIVSAFASLTTVLRFKAMLLDVAHAGGIAKVVVGVDLGGTSKQVLAELASWQPVAVTVVKNRRSGTTFHPKIYLFRWPAKALVYVGSNNLTDGGLFTNSEAASRTTFELPGEQAEFDACRAALSRFLDPGGPTARPLDEEYLRKLLDLREIPSDAEASRRRGEAAGDRRDRPHNIFGHESVPGPPALPPELQEVVFKARQQQNHEFRRARKRFEKKIAEAAGGIIDEHAPVEEEPHALIEASEFYINLPSMAVDNKQNKPGEMRIPLAAAEVAPTYFGLDQLVERPAKPRKKADPTQVNMYPERYARWKTWEAGKEGNAVVEDVRMYIYKPSQDFRQMSRELNRLGGSLGDIVRIRPGDDVDYECTLAKKDSDTWKEWEQYLVNEITNSERKFGFR